MNINFSVNGWMTQEIEITDNNFTEEDIIIGLQNGTIITGMSAGAPIVLVEGGSDAGWNVIGKVVSSTLEDGEMFDFEGD